MVQSFECVQEAQIVTILGKTTDQYFSEVLFFLNIKNLASKAS